MITAIRPYTPQNKQQQSFGAVHQKWVTKLIKDPVGMINNDFHGAIAFGDISKTDALDTLKNAQQHFNGKFKTLFDDEIRWAKNYIAPQG